MKLLQKIFLIIFAFNLVNSQSVFSMQKEKEHSCLSSSSSLTNQYSINLIWINRSFNENQLYIYPLSKIAINKDELNLEKYKTLLSEYKTILWKKCLDKYEQQIRFYWNTLNNTYSYTYNYYLNINKFNGDAYEEKEKLNENGQNQDGLKKYKQTLDSFKTEIDKCKVYCEEKSNLEKTITSIKKAKVLIDEYKITLNKNSLATYKELLKNYKNTLKDNASFSSIVELDFDYLEESAFSKTEIGKDLDSLEPIQINLEKYKNALELHKISLDNCFNKYLEEIEAKNATLKTNTILLEETKTNLEKYKSEVEEYITKLIQIDLTKANLVKSDLDQYKEYLIKTDLYKNFLNYIFRWADASQGHTVNIWYDSLLTPKQAIESTNKLFEQYGKDHKKSASIKLRDIRELKTVKENPSVFSDKISVYFRVDLLRPIIALNIISQNEYFVYADLDMEPLSQEQLFDNETLQNLQKYGIVMAYDDCYYFENGFQIIGNFNKNLIKAIELALIKRNIFSAKNDFVDEKKFWNQNNNSSENFNIAQLVFSSYKFMFAYFYSLEKYGFLELYLGDTADNEYSCNPLLLNDETILDYNNKKKFYRAYDLEEEGLSIASYYKTFFITRDKKILNHNPTLNNPFSFWIPTKKVKLPPSELKFN